MFVLVMFCYAFPAFSPSEDDEITIGDLVPKHVGTCWMQQHPKVMCYGLVVGFPKLSQGEGFAYFLLPFWNRMARLLMVPAWKVCGSRTWRISVCVACAENVVASKDNPPHAVEQICNLCIPPFDMAPFMRIPVPNCDWGVLRLEQETKSEQREWIDKISTSRWLECENLEIQKTSVNMYVIPKTP